ncbi:glycosyltransferase, partial [Candidatus Saccharibacteria bacterium]|nr:glycosyltransferase [Candidatus Saccharibacteria bacterium]
MTRETSRKNRALFSSHTANFSKFNLSFIELLKNSGYEVDYASAGEEPIGNVDHEFTVDFPRNPFKIHKLIKSYRQMKKILSKNHYDLIHTHTPVGSVVTRLAAQKTRRQGTKIIYTAHGFHFFKNASPVNWLLWYPVEKFCARLTDILITINREDYERAKKKFKTDVRYVPGVGIDTKKFAIKMTKNERDKYRKTLGLKSDDFAIIYVAEISKRKNQKQLLKEKAEIVRSNPKTHVLLVGGDTLNGRMQKLARELGIARNVHFLGYRQDIPKLLKISDLYCSTSRQEGLAMNVLEARLAGLPIEATTVRGHEPAFAKNIAPFLSDNINKQMAKIYKESKTVRPKPPKTTVFEKLFLLAPVFLFMTYSPALLMLQNDSKSMRLTPALIYVALTAVAAALFVLKRYRNLFKSRKLIIAASVVIANLAYAALSLFWTPDLSRGVIQVGSLAALTMIFVGAICVTEWKKLFRKLVKILLITSLFWCVFAWFQFWIGLFHPKFLNSFCHSCSAVAFGFVRPAGLTFEPQIFGNLLLAPTLISAYLIWKSPTKTKKSWYIVFSIFLITILLTLSRGAIYALALGLVVLLLAMRPKLSIILKTALAGVVGLAVAIILQGVAAGMNPHVDTSFADGVDTSVEQLTLGRIDLITSEENVSSPSTPPAENPASSPIYTGYVEISTNYRISVSERALDTWRRDLPTMFFGTGAGSGAKPIADNYDTVQNQHIETLLNYGLVGFALYATLLAGLFWASRRRKFVWAILASYLFQWAFFSGLPHGFPWVYFVLMGCFIYTLSVHPEPSKPAKRS